MKKQILFSIFIFHISQGSSELFPSLEIRSTQNCDLNDEVCKQGLKEVPKKHKTFLVLPEDLAATVNKAFKITEDEKQPETSIYIDLFGYKYNWTDLDDGWNVKRRTETFREHRRNTEQPDNIPAFTKLGYKKMKIPKDLYKFILKSRNLTDVKPEEECSVLANCQYILRFSSPDASEMNQKSKSYLAYFRRNNTEMMGWKIDENEVNKKIDEKLRPILENWIGGEIPLNFTKFYGIRRYLRGSNLGLHVDKPVTHVISAILQIDQNVDEDWPLTFIDNKYKRRKIFLKPGEMILYESARCPHGRQYPLKGEFFDNIFVHYKPAKVWYTHSQFPAGSQAPSVRRKLTLEDLKTAKRSK